MRWILPEGKDEELVAQMAEKLGVSRYVAEIISRRGYGVNEETELFLSPKLQNLSDPYLLPDMQAAVDRIFLAKERGESVVLYGDYDVDGVTSLALLSEVLDAYGIKVSTFLPHRMDEGYGLSPEGVERCLQEKNPDLLIAVDCGTSSVEEIRALLEKGVETVVLDHHECKEELPPAVAIVNPKRGDTFTYLCSVGIVFKVAHALMKQQKLEDYDLRGVLDLVAIGTVADLVPLEGDNRIMVRAGLRRLEDPERPGVKVLKEVSRLNGVVTAADIGFRLGPRLNASGRLYTAQESLELLQTKDPQRAKELASDLDDYNRDRQAMGQEILEQAKAEILEKDLGKQKIIILGREGWHSGMIGIVASQIMRMYYRPTIIVGFENGVGKGSGRSVEGFSLVHALQQFEKYLVKFGGHEMAAGFTVNDDQFEEFRQYLTEYAERVLTPEQLDPRLHLDVELPFEEMNFNLWEEYQALEPFGMGNPRPMFYARGVAPQQPPKVLKEKHLKFEFGNGRERIEAIYFGGATGELPRPPWDIAYYMDRNEFRGTVRIQAQVHAIRQASVE